MRELKEFGFMAASLADIISRSRVYVWVNGQESLINIVRCPAYANTISPKRELDGLSSFIKRTFFNDGDIDAMGCLH
jgi:hypothetical protein